MSSAVQLPSLRQRVLLGFVLKMTATLLQVMIGHGAPTEVPVSATVLLDEGAMRGALTTTLPPGVDPTGVGGGPECMHSEGVLCSPVTTLLLTLRSITPSPAVDCNPPSVVASAGRGRGALLRGVSQFATTGATTTL
jgi:hypothetical protein